MTNDLYFEIDEELALLNECLKEMCEANDRNKVIGKYLYAKRKIEKICEINLKRVSPIGHWIKHGTMVECSICEHIFLESEIRHNKDYCPFCDSKMEGRINNE